MKDNFDVHKWNLERYLNENKEYEQTAVDWLFLMLNNPNTDQKFNSQLYNKAKEIEKTQIMRAYQTDSDKSAEQYYTETFT
jgi:hypothetical protein